MEREPFLQNIARRLGRARLTRAPERAHRGVPEFHRAAPLEPAEASAAATTDLAQRFAEELTRVGGEVVLVPDLRALRVELERVLARFGARRIVTWSRAELADFELDWLFFEHGARAFGDEGLSREADLRAAALNADVGITAVDFAVALSGSLVVSAAPGRPRSVSLLPALHIALVRQSQLVARAGEALTAFGSNPRGLPSAVHFITGPSRTSDIENDLTIGVHGPASVVALLWQGG